MSLERLAAACVLPGFPGPVAPDWVRRRLSEGLGGVVLFAWNVESREQLAALTASLRAENEDVLIAIDEEGGDVTRLEASTGSSYPGNAALGAVDDVELTEQVAAAIGAELAAVGINVDLAPVADVNTNPLNPVIGIRSFGADGDLVARHVAAFRDDRDQQLRPAAGRCGGLQRARDPPQTHTRPEVEAVDDDAADLASPRSRQE